MDYRGQTAVLSVILVLVGMMFLVPAITEKALAVIHATAKGVCGPEGETSPCDFYQIARHLDEGKWVSEPTKEGTVVTWSTEGNPQPGDEKGSVTYYVCFKVCSFGGNGPSRVAIAVLSFENPLVGSNKCGITGIDGDCTAGKGMNAEFTYNLRCVAKEWSCRYG